MSTRAVLTMRDIAHVVVGCWRGHHWVHTTYWRLKAGQSVCETSFVCAKCGRHK